MSSVVSQIARLKANIRTKTRHRKAASDPGGGGGGGGGSLGRKSSARDDLIQDEQFLNGIVFDVQLIGSMDIPRPTSRVEIVAAMRRVRFEFKSKGIKKRGIKLQISVDGVVSLLRRKGDKMSGGDQQIVLKEHPIYRIFYVSHDSQDVKIFSYIARESNSNLFHCCVYKAKRKKQALRIVKTIGQAFEVCHKMRPRPIEQPHEIGDEGSGHGHGHGHGGGGGQGSIGGGGDKEMGEQLAMEERTSARKERAARRRAQKSLELDEVDANAHHVDYTSTLLASSNKQSTLERSSLKAQLQLMKDQLAVETAARIEAQARVEELLIHNQELLEHLESLVKHLNEVEARRSREEVDASVPPLQLPKLHGLGASLGVGVRPTRAGAVAGDSGEGTSSTTGPGGPPSPDKPVASPVKREVNFELNLPGGGSDGGGSDPKQSPRTICRSVSEKVTKPAIAQPEDVKTRSKWARHTTK